MSKKKVTVGNQSKNEILQDGQSATQTPTEYVFKTAKSVIHFIDTPGVGDVRGNQKDKENFDNILTFLLAYEKINGVCVLLKSNSSRLTVAFRFCVLELLTHLHKSLEQNLLFCFTNSRASCYKPGDTLPVLKRLLAENNIGLKLDNTRYFCFDNEAFRFLACLKNGVKLDDEERGMLSKSWEKSFETTEKLIKTVKNLYPHDTKKTVSMNEARNIILALNMPMAGTLSLINNNKKAVESVKNEIDSAEGEMYEFGKSLTFKAFVFKVQNLDHPITVCAHTDCKKFVPVGKTQVTNTVYDVICHDHCNLTGVPTETINDERLATCRAFDFNTAKARESFFGIPVKDFQGFRLSSGFVDGTDIPHNGPGRWTCDWEELKNSLTPARRKQFEELQEQKFTNQCWNCKHSFKQHMHITYTLKVDQEEFLSDEVQANINSIKDEKLKKDALKTELTNNTKELEEEREFIMECATNFGSFLKYNAMVPYNDAFKDYIDMLIRDEQSKQERVRDEKKIQNLIKDKNVYEEKKKVLDASMKASKGNHIKLEDIIIMKNSLVELKHNGRNLKHVLGKI